MKNVKKEKEKKSIFRLKNYQTKIDILMHVGVPDNQISLHFGVPHYQIQLHFGVPHNQISLHFGVPNNQISLNLHVPDNCSSTSYGWLRSSRSMTKDSPPQT